MQLTIPQVLNDQLKKSHMHRLSHAHSSDFVSKLAQKCDLMRVLSYERESYVQDDQPVKVDDALATTLFIIGFHGVWMLTQLHARGDSVNEEALKTLLTEAWLGPIPLNELLMGVWIPARAPNALLTEA